LTGPRKRLFLYPRGHLKTTVITIAHSIQWILNYPDVRILLSMATGDQVQRVMQEVLFCFRYNERFRWLYPDYCPAARTAKEFGTNDGFTVPNRKRRWMKEATVSTASVGKVIASGHYEVIKHSDLVDKENVKTPNQVADVISHFRYMNPLLERGPVAPHHGWTDVEGTRYDYSDLYGHIVDEEEKLPAEERTWQILVRSAINPDNTTLWPRRFPIAELKQMEKDLGPFIYCCQMLQRPIPVGSGLASKEEIVWVRPDIIKQLLPMLRLSCTIDLAGMEPDKTSGDFTVMTTAGWDRDGRLTVVDIRCDHYSAEQVIDLMFSLASTYKLECFKIEKDAHARVLLPCLKREISKRGQLTGRWLPPVVTLQRDNRTSKKQRIKGLQPFFAAGLIRFADGGAAKIETIQQILRFSQTSHYHDDILDTLADHLQGRDGEAAADLVPDAPRGEDPAAPRDQFLGFDPAGAEQWLLDAGGARYFDEMTGL
jgi:predicted phage terminase large subunit-like protein